jgi:hypothetical protein
LVLSPQFVVNTFLEVGATPHCVSGISRKVVPNYILYSVVNEVRELLAAELRQGKTRLINIDAIVQGS